MSTLGMVARIEQFAAELDGRAGVHLRHTGTGEEFSMAADELFPTACIIKVPILLTLMQRVVDGELDWHAPLTMTPERVYGLGQVVDRLVPGTTIELAELIHLMVSLSDVGAGLWCQELAGGGEAVNGWLADRGYTNTRVNSRTPGRESDFEVYGWGQTTPREALDLLLDIRMRRAVSADADAYVDRTLAATLFVQDSLAALPTDVHAIIKTGAVQASRSEILLISSPRGPLGCAVMTASLADTSWELDNAGQEFLRNVTDLVWREWGSGSHATRQGSWPPKADAFLSPGSAL